MIRKVSLSNLDLVEIEGVLRFLEVHNFKYKLNSKGIFVLDVSSEDDSYKKTPRDFDYLDYILGTGLNDEIDKSRVIFPLFNQKPFLYARFADVVSIQKNTSNPSLKFLERFLLDVTNKGDLNVNNLEESYDFYCFDLSSELYKLYSDIRSSHRDTCGISFYQSEYVHPTGDIYGETFKTVVAFQR